MKTSFYQRDARDAMPSSGKAEIFYGCTGSKSSLLRKQSLQNRMKINDLHLEDNEYLLLENQNMKQVPNRCSGLVCAFKQQDKLEWHLGAIVFQNIESMAIVEIHINSQVCLTVATIFMIPHDII